MLQSTPASADLQLIERFISAYNALDAHLQNALRRDAPSSFRSAVELYARHNRWWKDAELLRTCAVLRNVLVHERVRPYEYPCVPTEVLVERLEAARDRLLYPRLVIPEFEREVTTVQATDSLAHVLRLVHALQFTHFPVYDYADEKSHFLGVLTENGITRWLAEHVARELSLVDFSDAPIGEVLAREERRRNYEFTSRHTSVEALVHRFHENPYLEAVLLTTHGKEAEKLLGIVTRWDALRVE
jgi:CBS domain-containing protein